MIMVEDKPAAVVLLSGGLDSTTLLYKMRADGYEVYPLSVYYGQRHEAELRAAKTIIDKLGLWHNAHEVNLRRTGVQTILAGSSQTSNSVPVPDGRYDEESMKQTVVPNRNMILLSFATAWAISFQADV